jgi:hypothetical protein
MADAAKAPLSALEKTLLVVGVAAAGAALFYVGAKLVQAARESELRRSGASHVHAFGLTGAVGLLPLASGGVGIKFAGLHHERDLLEIGHE